MALAQTDTALSPEDQKLFSLIRNSGDAAKYKSSALLTVFERVVTHVEDSGLSRVRVHKLVKILSPKGALQLQVLRFDYDPASSDAKILKVRIFRQDGSMQVIDLANLRDLPQPQWMLYWGARMRLLDLPRLQIGDAVEMIYTRKGFVIAYLNTKSHSASTSSSPKTSAPPAGNHQNRKCLSRSCRPVAQPENSATSQPVRSEKAVASDAAKSSEGNGDESRFVPPMRGHFYDIVYFVDKNPIVEKTYELVLPRDKPLNYKLYNATLGSSQQFDDKTITYKWWKRDIPALKTEPRMSAYNNMIEDHADIIPKLVLATVPDWQAKSRWFYEVNEPMFAADEHIRRKVEELLKGKKTDLEKVSTLLHWVADEIRYSGISMGKGEGYTIHPSSMTFYDRAGVCKDLAGMLVTMLRLAGYETYAAMTMAGARVETVPADQFNHCVVAIKRADGSFWMVDPTWAPYSRELWSSAEQHQNYVIGTPSGEGLMITPYVPPEQNYVRIKANSTLLKTGKLQSQISILSEGFVDAGFRRVFAYRPARNSRYNFLQMLAVISPKTELQTSAHAPLADYSKPFALDLSYSIADYALQNQQIVVLRAPLSHNLLKPLRRLTLHLDIPLVPKRQHRLVFRSTQEVTFDETIALPKGYTVAHLPAGQTYRSPVLDFDGKWERKNHSLRYYRKLSLKQKEIPPAQYKFFRDGIKILNAFDRAEVYLHTKPPKADAPSQISAPSVKPGAARENAIPSQNSPPASLTDTSQQPLIIVGSPVEAVSARPEAKPSQPSKPVEPSTHAPKQPMQPMQPMQPPTTAPAVKTVGSAQQPDLAAKSPQIVQCVSQSQDTPLSLAPPQRELPDYLDAKLNARDHANADVYIYRHHERFRLDRQGLVQHEYHQAIHYFNHHGIDHYGDPRFNFNSRTQHFKPIQMRTIVPDGSIKYPKCNSFNVALSDQMARAPGYTDLKQLVVTYIGLERGATSELTISLADRKRVRSHLWGEMPVQTDQPVGSYALTVTVPKGTKLFYACVRCKLTPIITHTDSETIYRWQRQDAPAFDPEDSSSPQNPLVYPRIIFSTAPTWATLRNLLQERLDKAIALSPALERHIAKLKSEYISDIDRLRAIYDFVIHHVENIAWDLNAFDFQIRPAAMVYNSAYGNALDRAALLVAMLRHADISAQLALVARESNIASAVPALSQLTHPVVRVSILDREYWLDPLRNSLYLRPTAWDGRSYLLIAAQAQLAKFPTSAPTQHQSVLLANLTVSNSSKPTPVSTETLPANSLSSLAITGQFFARFSGAFNPYHKAVTSEPQPDVNQALKALSSGVAGDASNLHISQWGPESSAFSFAAKRKLDAPNKANYVALQLPQPPIAHPAGKVPIYREAHHTPIYLDFPASEKIQIQINLPSKGIEIAYLPPSVNLRNRVGQITYRSQYNPKTRQIQWYRELTIYRQSITAKNYADFRQILQLYKDPHRQRIILKPEQK
jgi:transglutaminase-like putative cysteine protease